MQNYIISGLLSANDLKDFQKARLCTGSGRNAESEDYLESKGSKP